MAAGLASRSTRAEFMLRQQSLLIALWPRLIQTQNAMARVLLSLSRSTFLILKMEKNRSDFYIPGPSNTLPL
jgi:hypothetical protein